MSFLFGYYLNKLTGHEKTLTQFTPPLFSEEYSPPVAQLALCPAPLHAHRGCFQKQVSNFASASPRILGAAFELSKQTNAKPLSCTLVKDGCHLWDEPLCVSCLPFHSQWWEDTRCSWAVPTEHGWDKSLCTSRGSSKSIGRSTSAPGTALKHTDEPKAVAVGFMVLWANSRSYSRLSLSPVRISFKAPGTCEMSLFACIIHRHRYSSVRAIFKL